METKMKIFSIMLKIFSIMLLLIGVLALSGVASAAVIITEVEVNGVEIEKDETLRLDVVRGEDIEVRVTIESDNASLDDVQIEAFIRGYDHDDLIEDITDVFDVKENRIYTKKLDLTVPRRIDIGEDDEYTMVVLVESRDGVLDTLTWNVDLAVSSERHLLEIRDIVLNPEREVKAGRALLTTVRVKNYGENTEDDVKVIVRIPELGVSASDYIDELDEDESTTSEELYMRIPGCAEPGNYRVEVEVEYDDGDEVLRDSTVIAVVEGDTCMPIVPGPTPLGPETIITVSSETQDVVQGAGGVVYPVTITNTGRSARTYTIMANGANWANFRVSPASTIIVNPGEATSVFVYVAAKADAPVGQQMFVVTVSSAGGILEQEPLRANVLAGGVSVIGIKKGLEIGLIVLVVLLVILGLIIGFNKLRAEPEEEGKTYY